MGGQFELSVKTDGLHYKKAHGKAKSADFAAAQEWLANMVCYAFLKKNLVKLGAI